MLETAFPRIAGDLGRPDSWSRPVLPHVVRGALPRRVVQSADALRASGLLQAFVDGARQLEARGAAAITTSCGFLVLFQQELAAAVRVPVVTSSLLLLPGLLDDEAQVGVLTIDAASLSADHLLRAGVPAARQAGVRVQGMPPAGAFAGAILGNRPDLDAEAARREAAEAARALTASAPQLRTLVLECTNLPPYRDAIAAATGLRVLSLADSPVLSGRP